MEFTHAFMVPVPVDEAFAVLTDLERIAPCMPGATLKSVDDEGYHGIVKVKVGPVQMTFQGTATLVERDDVAKTAKVHAAGRDQRGGGTASADVRAELVDEDGATAVTVTTDITITGKAARFGRGMMAEVGGAIISEFATRLAAELERTEPAPTSPTATDGAADEEAATEPAPASAPTATPAPTSPLRAVTGDAEPLDLALVARTAAAKRAAPVVLLVLLLLLVARRRRTR